MPMEVCEEPGSQVVTVVATGHITAADCNRLVPAVELAAARMWLGLPPAAAVTSAEPLAA